LDRDDLLRSDHEVFESEEIRPGVMIDLDQRGEIIGLEMLRVSERLPSAELTHLEFDLRRAFSVPSAPASAKRFLRLRDFSSLSHTSFILPG